MLIKIYTFSSRKCIWKCCLEKAAILPRPQCVNEWMLTSTYTVTLFPNQICGYRYYVSDDLWLWSGEISLNFLEVMVTLTKVSHCDSMVFQWFHLHQKLICIVMLGVSVMISANRCKWWFGTSQATSHYLIQFWPANGLMLKKQKFLPAPVMIKISAIMFPGFQWINSLAPGRCRSEFNSLRPSDANWRRRSGSTLAQVMACCLTAPSH